MIGWLLNTAEADDYFAHERFDSACWDLLAATSGSGTDIKDRLLTYAYNRIRYSKKHSIPVAPTAAQLEKLKKAECELAYYLCIHSRDEDRRKGLQAQAVVAAGIVKETYDPDRLNDLPFPPFVLELLDEFAVEPAPFYASDIDRDENEPIDYDPTGVDNI